MVTVEVAGEAADVAASVRIATGGRGTGAERIRSLLRQAGDAQRHCARESVLRSQSKSAGRRALPCAMLRVAGEADNVKVGGRAMVSAMVFCR